MALFGNHAVKEDLKRVRYVQMKNTGPDECNPNNPGIHTFTGRWDAEVLKSRRHRGYTIVLEGNFSEKRRKFDYDSIQLEVENGQFLDMNLYHCEIWSSDDDELLFLDLWPR